MRRLLLALVFIPMTVPVYAERNCTDYFSKDAYETWDDCTGTAEAYKGSVVYEGDWQDGNQHGNGKYSWADGSVYEGGFWEGERSGNGTHSSANGDVYEGNFKSGYRHGYGEYSWASGAVYKGQFSGGEQNGKGTETWADGTVYEGDYKDGYEHGEGKLWRPDGTLIKEGSWVDGDYSESLTSKKKGMDFRDGNGVLQNYELAKKFFVLAAQGGDNDAMFYLAEMYNDEKIVDELTLAETVAGWFAEDSESKSHLIKAHMWANLAGKDMIQTIENGFSLKEIKQARGLIAGLIHTIEPQLNPDEIKQAQDLARECLENDYQGC